MVRHFIILLLVLCTNIIHAQSLTESVKNRVMGMTVVSAKEMGEEIESNRIKLNNIFNQIKEKGGPEEIDGQLQEIDSKCTGDCVFISTGYENQIRRDSHQKVQDGPYHWKQPGRRRQWRLIERPEGIHFIAGQKRCGQTCK